MCDNNKKRIYQVDISLKMYVAAENDVGAERLAHENLFRDLDTRDEHDIDYNARRVMDAPYDAEDYMIFGVEPEEMTLKEALEGGASNKDKIERVIDIARAEQKYIKK